MLFDIIYGGKIILKIDLGKEICRCENIDWTRQKKAKKIRLIL
jgi:hypothetical protein